MHIRTNRIVLIWAVLLLFACTTATPTVQVPIAITGNTQTSTVEISTARPSDTPIPDTSTPTTTDTQAPESTETHTPSAQPATDTPRPPTETPAIEMGQVVNVVDGDTIDVSLNGTIFRVRYIGINTPESSETCGGEATAANAELVSGQTVSMLKDVSETDQFGRLLRYVYVGEVFINAELIDGGYAEAVEYPPDTSQAEYLESLEAQARAANLACYATGVFGGGVTGPTATPTREPPTQEPTIQPSATESPPSANVQITYVLFDGVVYRVESDEYAVIQNVGGQAVNIAGWRLNAGDPGQDFNFPSVELQPGQACRVYTNEVHPETCGFSFGRGQAIWNNDGDCGYLYDPSGAEVSRYCY